MPKSGALFNHSSRQIAFAVQIVGPARAKTLTIMDISRLDPQCPVLIAGPTASGKSELALQIAEAQGGVIVNADASQVFDGWRVLTARPSAEDEARAPHALYGHVPFEAAYSAGHWLREVRRFIETPQARPIIVGGTGLYFLALTEGMAEIPPTPPEIRARADALRTGGQIDVMRNALDTRSAAKIDLLNPMRVQRAWEVLQSTGRGIADWQADTPPPLLPLPDAQAIVLEAEPDWLNARIAQRFDAMLQGGALDEARANQHRFDPSLLSCKAIGAPELQAYLNGEITLPEAREAATIATRQFAKRQRTWFRARMKAWTRVALPVQSD